MPDAPYFFQNSKRFPGKSLEELLFNNSSSFFGLARQAHRENDSMHAHIKFILTAGDDLDIKFTCPFCQKEQAKFFLLLDNHIVSNKLICCGEESCRKALKAGHGDDMLIAFKLKNLGMRIFATKTLRKKVEQLFRQALELKPKSSPKEIFSAISKKYLKYFEDEAGIISDVMPSSSQGVLKEAIKKEPLSFKKRMSKMAADCRQQLKLEL